MKQFLDEIEADHLISRLQYLQMLERNPDVEFTYPFNAVQKVPSNVLYNEIMVDVHSKYEEEKLKTSGKEQLKGMDRLNRLQEMSTLAASFLNEVRLYSPFIDQIPEDFKLIKYVAGNITEFQDAPINEIVTIEDVLLSKAKQNRRDDVSTLVAEINLGTNYTLLAMLKNNAINSSNYIPTLRETIELLKTDSIVPFLEKIIKELEYDMATFSSTVPTKHVEDALSPSVIVLMKLLQAITEK